MRKCRIIADSIYAVEQGAYISELLSNFESTRLKDKDFGGFVILLDCVKVIRPSCIAPSLSALNKKTASGINR